MIFMMVTLKMKVKKASEKEIEEFETRRQRRGQYDEIFNQVIESGEPVILEDLSVGQAWGIRKRAKAKFPQVEVLIKNLGNGKAKVLIRPSEV